MKLNQFSDENIYLKTAICDSRNGVNTISVENEYILNRSLMEIEDFQVQVRSWRDKFEEPSD